MKNTVPFWVMAFLLIVMSSVSAQGEIDMSVPAAISMPDMNAEAPTIMPDSVIASEINSEISTEVPVAEVVTNADLAKPMGDMGSANNTMVLENSEKKPNIFVRIWIAIKNFFAGLFR